MSKNWVHLPLQIPVRLKYRLTDIWFISVKPKYRLGNFAKKLLKIMLCLGAPGLGTPCCGSSGAKGLNDLQPITRLWGHHASDAYCVRGGGVVGTTVKSWEINNKQWRDSINTALQVWFMSDWVMKNFTSMPHYLPLWLGSNLPPAVLHYIYLDN